MSPWSYCARPYYFQLLIRFPLSRLLGTGNGVRTGVCNHLGLGVPGAQLRKADSGGGLQVSMTEKLPQLPQASKPGPVGLREIEGLPQREHCLRVTSDLLEFPA